MPISAFRRSSKAILAATLTLGFTALQAQLPLQSLQITSPADGTVFNPGQTVAVTVGPPGVGFSYLMVGGPIGFGTPVPGATNQFSILIPTTTPPGYYTLVAGGVTQGQTVSSPQITIGVQRPDAPIRLSVEPSTFEKNVGEKGYLNVFGTYSDGSSFFLSHAPNTTYLSNNPSIATVDSQGIITAVSPGSTTIVVNGSAIVSVTVDPPMTLAPLKKALYAGQSQQFTPRSADRSIPPVAWSTNPPDAGSVSATGVYTAPSQITLQQPVILTATSLADNTISATATVTLLPPLALSVAPSSVNLSQSQTCLLYTSDAADE